MIFYVGACGEGPTLNAVRERPDRMGVMVFRGERSRIRPDVRWAYDNGAYADFVASRPFDEATFLSDVEAIEAGTARPTFMVVPDIVQGGERSLEHSLEWLGRLPRSLPWMLAVQDGMSPESVAGVLDPGHAPGFSGLFVGGSSEFKATLPVWVALARERGLKCHPGRASTVRRVLWARVCGADSADSVQFQWARRKLGRLLGLVDSGFVDDQTYLDLVGGEQDLESALAVTRRLSGSE